VDTQHRSNQLPLTRRQLLVAAALTPLAARSAAGAASPAVDDWAQTGRDLAATRRAPHPLRAITPTWSQRLAGGVPGVPAAVGDRVYAASVGGEVAALDRATGAVIWKRALPVPQYGDVTGAPRLLGFTTGPAVTWDGGVIVASDRVTRLDARTGATQWEAPPLRTPDSDDYFWGAPTLVGDVVLVGSGSGSELPTARGRVTAYDARTGRLRWSTATVPVGANGGGVISPLTVDVRRGSVYAATGAPYEAVPGDNPGTCSLLELDLETGAVRWADQLHPANRSGFDLNSAPMLLGSTVVVTSKTGIHAWDRVSRRRLWSRALTPATTAGQSSTPFDGPEFGPLATDGNVVLAASNDLAAGAFVAAALHRATSAVLWSVRLPGFVLGAPAVAGGDLVVATAAGVIHVLRCSDGARTATAALPGPSAGGISSAGGAAFIGTGYQPYFPGDLLVRLG
jgi:outer membrane protein assembly factor BamB